MDALVVNNAYRLVCFFGLKMPHPPPQKKVVPKWIVIHRNRVLQVVEKSGKKDFATKGMSGIDKAG